LLISELFNVLLFHSLAGVFHPQVFILRNVSGTGRSAYERNESCVRYWWEIKM